MGLPPSVMALLGRMTSYRDRMAWTVVEDACRVCLTLSWEVGERRRRVLGGRSGGDPRQHSVEGTLCDPGAAEVGASCKQSLWTRIRRSLHPRRSVSVDSTTTTTTTADVHRHPPHMTSSHWRLRDVNDERACAARERWRRHRSASASRGTSDVGAGAGVGWDRQRQRSWNEGWQQSTQLVEPSAGDLLLTPTTATTTTPHIGAALECRRPLLPSLSLPERFLQSPPPLHHHYQHQHQHHHHRHRHQHQQPAQPQDECLRAVLSPQYDTVINSVGRALPLVSYCHCQSSFHSRHLLAVIALSAVVTFVTLCSYGGPAKFRSYVAF